MGPRRDGSTVTQPLRQIDHRHGAHYATSITAYREAKDARFRAAADSPLRQAGADWHALSYFPVDESYRIVVTRLRRPPANDQPIALDTSDGLRRIARRVGYLDFDLHGQRLALTAFGFGPTERGSLFIPFADATSGNETYGSGRYLDLEIDPDGSVALDFNLAYHPYCAYSSAYSCPLAPVENHLAVPILAGERLPP
jgi:hypothetical protein